MPCVYGNVKAQRPLDAETEIHASHGPLLSHLGYYVLCCSTWLWHSVGSKGLELVLQEYIVDNRSAGRVGQAKCSSLEVLTSDFRDASAQLEGHMHAFWNRRLRMDTFTFSRIWKPAHNIIVVLCISAYCRSWSASGTVGPAACGARSDQAPWERQALEVKAIALNFEPGPRC